MPDSLPVGPIGAVFLSHALRDVRVPERDIFRRKGEAVWTLPAFVESWMHMIDHPVFISMKTSSRRFGLRACLRLAMLAALAVAGRAAPTAVVDDDGHFAATFPAAVKRANRIIDKEDIGQIATFQVYTSQGAVAFKVAYNDYPEGYVASTGAAAVYKGAAKEAADIAKGTIRGEDNCKLGSVGGLEVVIDGPDRGFVERIRLYLVGDRLFEVAYVGPPDSEAGKAALDFLDSFRLLPVPENK
jgi:hypothetical protein